MKHTIAWTMNGTVEFDSDETDIDAIVEDFNSAVYDGFDFMRRGDVDGWKVDEIDDQHVHEWLSGMQDGFDRCYGCRERRPHIHSWRRVFKDPTQQTCLTCYEKRPTP